ncbi:hypothetical protein BY996DRAFT_6568211 [Phakopsora pachyrhizi]|nr:hypothetical protein BY996DRAFT_6568211 [Phakopsora pachyrhizi]
MTVLIDGKLEDPLIKDKKVSLLGGVICGQKISMGLRDFPEAELELSMGLPEAVVVKSSRCGDFFFWLGTSAVPLGSLRVADNYPSDKQTPYYGYGQPDYVTGHAKGSGSSIHNINDFQSPCQLATNSEPLRHKQN